MPGTTTVMPAGINNIYINSLVATSTTLYAGTLKNGVFRSEDRGQNWEYIGLRDISGFFGPPKCTLAVVGTRLFVGTWGAGVFYIDDGAS